MTTQRLVVALVFFAWVQGVPSWSAETPRGRVSEAAFRHEITNAEYLVRYLTAESPPQLEAAPEWAGEGTWFGVVPRRVPGQALGEKNHFIPFMVSYVRGIASRAWCDTNLNGDLSDDAPIPLSAYPGIAEGRSFLADFQWMANVDSGDIPVRRKTRVVLEPRTADSPPVYRLQAVFGMLGTVTLEGKPHRALLHDGDANGIYTNAFPDGVFVDLDDDLEFMIEPMSADFGPFGVPFHMGRRIYEVENVDPRGRQLVVREKAVVEPMKRAVMGEPAPPFSFVDTTGTKRSLADYEGRDVLLYFWSSDCGACWRQAEPLQGLYERYRPSGLEILGISYDTDSAAVKAFREKHGQAWPTSFTGLRSWENPVGRQYRAHGSGMIYLVDSGGRLEGIFSVVEEVESRLKRRFLGVR